MYTALTYGLTSLSLRRLRLLPRTEVEWQNHRAAEVSLVPRLPRSGREHDVNLVYRHEKKITGLPQILI